MAKRNKKARKPRKPSSQSKFATRPARMQSPSRVKLQKLFHQMAPHIRAMGFNNVVLVGYRRVPEHEREQHKGAEEVPDILSDFPDPFCAVSLLNWAKENGERRLIQMAAETPPPKPEPKEDP